MCLDGCKDDIGYTICNFPNCDCLCHKSMEELPVSNCCCSKCHQWKRLLSIGHALEETEVCEDCYEKFYEK